MGVKKFTFKKEKKETGLRAVGNPWQSVYIKLDGKVVGRIDAPNWRSQDNKWTIRLAVKQKPEPDSPADFGWVTLKTRFDLEDSRAGDDVLAHVRLLHLMGT